MANQAWRTAVQATQHLGLPSRNRVEITMMKAIYDAKSNQLTITIDCNSQPTPSASGKTRIVASSGGNQAVAVGGDTCPHCPNGTVTVGLNAYVK